MTKRASSSANGILDRMKDAAGAHTDSALAKKLNIPRQSISHARKTGKIPDSWLIKACDTFNTDIDWLKTGLQDSLAPLYFADILESKGISCENVDFEFLQKIYPVLMDAPSSLKDDMHIPTQIEVEDIHTHMKNTWYEILQSVLIKIVQRYSKVKNKLEQKENECDELIEENRNLWRKNSELYEQILELKKLKNCKPV